MKRIIIVICVFLLVAVYAWAAITEGDGSMTKCGTFGLNKVVYYTGHMTPIANLPDDDGTALECVANYAWCTFERAGNDSADITLAMQIGEYPGLSSTLAFYNGTDATILNTTNSAATYRQTFANEGGDHFRIQLQAGTDAITNATCHFDYDPQ